MSKNKPQVKDFVAEKETISEEVKNEKEDLFPETKSIEIGSLATTEKNSVKPEVGTMGKTNKMICRKWCEKHDTELTPQSLVTVFIQQNPSKALTDAEWWNLWNKFINKKITQ